MNDLGVFARRMMASFDLRSILLGASILTVAGGFSTQANAYPSFVLHGYSTCMACHFHPQGNGPVTDYGRAVAATLIARPAPWARPTKGIETTQDEVSVRQSGFLGTVELPRWLRPSVSYRGMWLQPSLQIESSESRWVQMQAEASVTVQSKGAKWMGTATYGYVPAPYSAPAAQKSQYANWITREHYVGARVLKEWHFYLGLMDPSFGLRIPEHNAYIRSYSGRGINDQAHGLLVHFHKKKSDLYLQGMLGNFQQLPSLRLKGGALSYEHELFPGTRGGASALWTQNEFRYRRLLGVFSRSQFKKNGSGLLGELTVQQTGNSSNSLADTTGMLSFFQWTSLLDRGWYASFTLQNRIDSFKSESGRSIGMSPGVQWFPFPRLELRAEMWVIRSMSGSTLAQDDLSSMVQLHVWL